MSEKQFMPADPTYDHVSLMEFQVSMLNLAAALDLPAPIGTKEVSKVSEVSKVARMEAERLKAWVARQQK